MRKLTDTVRTFLLDPLGEGFLVILLMLLVMWITL